MKRLSVFISTLFGIGYFPKAPGAAGSFAAAVFYFLLPKKIFLSTVTETVYLTILVISAVGSVFFISKAEEILGHDNGKIVIDEFFGYLVAVLFLPKTLVIIGSAFILFRIFDILKPEPVNVLQKLPKGWGVLADDVMAGIYANISLQILCLIFPGQLVGNF